MAEKQLEGELLADKRFEVKYHVYQKEERFVQQGQDIYRQNSIWRSIHTKGHNPSLLEDVLLYENNVRVKYKIMLAS